ncbi:MAG: nitrogenase component 1 [Candidatus Methanomethylophilaceae archaeon]
MQLNDRPEGMLGELIALEGVRDAMSLIHGPTGCKYYPASCSESQFKTRNVDGARTFDPFLYNGEFFFCQPRVPCTYLDGRDYIMGTGDKLERLLSVIESTRPGMIGIINSPGASLIGEELSSLDSEIPLIRMEMPGYSRPIGDGFQDALLKILKTFRHVSDSKKETVNLIGISIWHLNWEDSVDDLVGLLALCDIGINVVIGAGWTTEEISHVSDASVNLVINPEYCENVVKWMESEYGIPYIAPDHNGLMSFDGLENWIVSVCAFLGKSPDAALDAVKAKRKRSAQILSGLDRMRLLPRGHTFSVSADAGIVDSVVRFLYEYLGMIPVAVEIDGNPRYSDIDEYLEEKNIQVSRDVFNTPAEILISNANLISSMKSRDMISEGVEVSRPTGKIASVAKEPVIGLYGTVRLLDSVLNALRPY